MSDILIGLVFGAPIGAICGYFGGLVSEGKLQRREPEVVRVAPEQLRSEVLGNVAVIETEEDLILRELEACDDLVVAREIKPEVQRLVSDTRKLREVVEASERVAVPAVKKKNMPHCKVCNLLARHKPAEDGSYYCKRHTPGEEDA